MASNKAEEKIVSNVLKKVYNEAGGVVGIGFGFLDFYSNVKQGDSIPKAAVKAVATDVVFNMMPGPMQIAFIGGGILKAGYDITEAAFKGVQAKLGDAARPFTTNINPYLYNGAPATIRQRYLQAMQDNKINVRSALGREAEYLHR